MKQQINWTKLPSVTRPGKSFYRATVNGQSLTLLQSYLTGQWSFNERPELGEFTTAKLAQTALA